MAFKNLRFYLATNSGLARPDFSQVFVVRTEANSMGSGSLNLDIRRGRKSYRVCLLWCYIGGSYFTVVSDNSSLRWLVHLKIL